MSSRCIETLRGAQARSLLRDAQFRQEWTQLCSQCPWATTFQHPHFVFPWYEVYDTCIDPLLIVSRDENGRINGVLPLAIWLDDGTAIVAGGGQAEYQAWICQPSLSGTFPWEAIRALQQGVRHAKLTFRFLPAATPTGWLADPAAKPLCRLTPYRRPLLQFRDGKEIATSLQKKSNKSRLNRLKKFGPLDFRHITEMKEVTSEFDAIIAYYDFRQAAVHNSLPFRNDRFKKPFHLALMNSPGVLHMTVLKVGNRLASAHLGAWGRNEVQLGIIAHDPFLAKCSPGKFHILFLAQMLMKQGYEQLDLTPGGDAYKERFSNAFDTVHTLTIYPSPAARKIHTLRQGAERSARNLLTTFRIKPTRVKSVMAKCKQFHPVRHPLSLARTARQWINREREMRIYSFEAANLPEFDLPLSIRRDKLDDLLLYEPAEAWQSRDHFLSDALRRIAEGVHAYTYVQDGRLLHYGWLIERQRKSFVSEVQQEFIFPAHSACLFDFYTFPQARGRGLYTVSIQTMLRDATRIPNTEKIFIAVRADNLASRHVIEKTGFTFECSLFDQVRLGRHKQWRTFPSDKHAMDRIER